MPDVVCVCVDPRHGAYATTQLFSTQCFEASYITVIDNFIVKIDSVQQLRTWNIYLVSKQKSPKAVYVLIMFVRF